MLFFSSAIFFCLLFLQWEVCIYLQTVSIIYMFFWDFSLSTRLQFYSGSLCSRLFQLWVALQLIWVTRATILIGPYLFLSLLCLSASPPFLFPRLRVSISLTHCSGCFWVIPLQLFFSLLLLHLGVCCVTPINFKSHWLYF